MIENNVMSEDQKKFALVLPLSGSMLHGANLAMEILSERFSIAYIASRSPSPHITMDSEFRIYDIKQFYSTLEASLEHTASFFLKGKGLGIFVLDTPVIHIRWIVNDELNALRKQIHLCLLDLQKRGVVSGYRNDPSWLPKTTIAFSDTSYDNLTAVLESINGINFSGNFHVENLSIYEYSLKGGEISISNIDFHPWDLFIG